MKRVIMFLFVLGLAFAIPSVISTEQTWAIEAGNPGGNDPDPDPGNGDPDPGGEAPDPDPGPGDPDPDPSPGTEGSASGDGSGGGGDPSDQFTSIGVDPGFFTLEWAGQIFTTNKGP